MLMEPPLFRTDEKLFASLAGGQAIIDWFGFCPVFHDGELEKLELSGGNAALSIRTFRMTDELDDNKFFILDKHALVTLHMFGVSGVQLSGDAQSMISELMIRRLRTDASTSDWPSCQGPITGDIEVTFDTAIGLRGSIFARELTFELQPSV